MRTFQFLERKLKSPIEISDIMSHIEIKRYWRPEEKKSSILLNSIMVIFLIGILILVPIILIRFMEGSIFSFLVFLSMATIGITIAVSGTILSIIDKKYELDYYLLFYSDATNHIENMVGSKYFTEVESEGIKKFLLEVLDTIILKYDGREFIMKKTNRKKGGSNYRVSIPSDLMEDKYFRNRVLYKEFSIPNLKQRGNNKEI